VLPTEGCGVAGVGTTPGNSADTDRGNAGTGAAARSGSAGGPGRVVIYY